MIDTSLEVRNAIVARLKTSSRLKKKTKDSTGADVESMLVVRPRPQKVDVKTFALLAQSGAVLVQNSGSRYETKSLALGAVVQEREMLFDVVVLYRNVSEQMSENKSADDEIYEFVFEIIRLLQGWRPPECYEPMRVVSEEFIDEQDGIWQYGIRFAVKTLAVETVTEPELPTLSEVNFNENGI